MANLNQNAMGQQPNRVWIGLILTELILKINEYGIDPDKSELFILGVDQLRRNLEYKFDSKFETLVQLENERWDKIAQDSPIDQRGQRNMQHLNQCQYMKAKGIFSLLMRLVDETSGERVFVDEVGEEADQFLDEEGVVERVAEEEKP